MVLSDDELNKTLKPLLQTIVNEKVTLDDGEAKRNIRIMMEVVDRLVLAMRKEDELFNELFQPQPHKRKQPVYTGSYYEGLRVKSADEFDLNLVLRLPFNRNDVEISWCEHDAAYVKYKLNRHHHDILKGHQKNKPLFDKMDKWNFFDSEHFLQQDKIRQWIQSTVTKAMKGTHFQKHPDATLEEPKQSGPVWTYQIKTKWGNIDVDLVAVIDASPYNPPDGMDPGERFETLDLANEFKTNWFLVPKPFKPRGEKGQTEKAMPARYWRMAFPEGEKKLLKDTGCLRLLIKLFKLLRDFNELWRYPLPSYFIKTFFLWEYEKKNSNEWQQINSGTLFMQMLENLKEAVRKRSIPYYFNRGGNLLASMSFKISGDIEGRIKYFLNKIRLDPQYVLEMYGLDTKKGKENIMHNSTESFGRTLTTAPFNTGFNEGYEAGFHDEKPKKEEESSWRCVIL